MTRIPTSNDPGMLRGSAVAKWEYVRDQIAAAVRSGEFRPGQRLPSERELATRFNVSYMTARRAVTALVASSTLERRDRSGTYVASSGAAGARRHVALNLVCTAYESPVIDELVAMTHDLIAPMGWSMSLLRVPEDNQGPVVRAILDGEASMLLIHDQYPWKEVRAAIGQVTDKIVVMGSRLDHLGVRSVQSDDAFAMRLAVSHLQELGHERIAYLLHDFASPSSQLRISVWRSCFPSEPTAELNGRLVRFVVPPFRNQAEHAYEAWKAYLGRPSCDVTAVVCQNNEVAVGALAACRDAQRPVPRRMSIVALGESVMTRLAEPPLTSIDYDRQAEVRCALEMLEDSLAGRLPAWDCLRLTTPRLIQRKSAGPPPASD